MYFGRYLSKNLTFIHLGPWKSVDPFIFHQIILWILHVISLPACLLEKWLESFNHKAMNSLYSTILLFPQSMWYSHSNTPYQVQPVHPLFLQAGWYFHLFPLKFNWFGPLFLDGGWYLHSCLDLCSLNLRGLQVICWWLSSLGSDTICL